MSCSEREDQTGKVLLALRRHEQVISSVPSLSRYLQLEKIGEGAVGVVYRALDSELRRPVALKILKDSACAHESARLRFQREARVTARLSHPNVVTVHDVGNENGLVFLVMELVDGRPLSEILSTRSLGLRPLLEVLEKAARGVGCAHEKGIVHRDLKPANILVTGSGEPKVGDFGLAHVVGSETALTRTGATLGTPKYMAPEQVEGGARPVTPRTDVYALGAILYEILGGKPPYDGETTAALYRKILTEDPAPLKPIHPSLPAELEAVCRKALEKDPKRRYADAAEFAEELRRYLEGEPVRAKPPGLLRKGTSWLKRHRVAGAATGAGIVGILTMAMILVPRWTSEREAKERNERELWNQRENEIVRARALEKSRIHLEAGRRVLEQMRMMKRNRRHLEEQLVTLAQEAEREFARAFLEVPDHPEAHLGIARAFALARKPDRALETLDKLIRVSPRFSTAYLDRVRLMIVEYARRREDPRSGAVLEETPKSKQIRERLETDLELALQYTGDSVERQYATALLALCEGSLETAERELARYLAHCPADPEALAVRGIVLHRLKKMEEAEEAVTLSLEYDSLDPLSLGLRALIRNERGALPGALEDYDRLVEIRPVPEVFLNRGNVRMSARDFAGAIADFDEAISRSPGYVLAHFNRANARNAIGNAEAAFQDFEETIRLDPTHADAYLNRGILHRRKGDSAAAIADYDTAIRLNPANGNAYFNRALVRASLGDFEGAIADLSRLIEINPKDVEGWCNRGALRHQKGDIEGAIQDLETALEAAPSGWPLRTTIQQQLLTLRNGR